MPNLVVDSSVWVDFFNNKKSVNTKYLSELLLSQSWKSPVTIFPVIMQEVLQGIENDNLYNTIKENLNGLEFVTYESYHFAIKSAELYRKLRKKGITIRKANDCIIATLCIHFDIPLFHNDKDFDNIAKHTSLKIYKPTNDKN